MKPSITVIVATALNRAIGRDNKLLWRLPEDMKLFVANTRGRTLVMGRRTAESIGRPLPNRRNLVLTSGDAPFEGVEVVRSLQEAIDLAAGNELCVIGGERLYVEALPLAGRLKITIVIDSPVADAFFPDVDLKKWQLIETQSFPETEDAPMYTYGEYVRHEHPITLGTDQG